jgi:hypothetical protein
MAGKHGSKDPPLQGEGVRRENTEVRGQSTEMTENSNGREEDGDKRRYRE